MDEFDHIFEYLIVIEPDSNVSAFSIQTKQFFESEYGCSHSSSSKPHITIAHFLCLTPNEKRILKHLKLIASTTKAPEVAVDGFGHFENHTIFLNILNSIALTNLARRIEKTCKSSTIRGVKSVAPSFTTRSPHLTIARAMTEAQFSEAWQHWKDEPYTADFKASELLVLKRHFSLQKVESFAVESTLRLTGSDEIPVQGKLPF